MKTRFKPPNARAVEPLRDKRDIRRVREYLTDMGRYGGKYCLLFTIGINTGLRAGDLRLLTYGQLRDKKYLELTEQKTGKTRQVLLNTKVKSAIREYFKDYLFVSDNAYLFVSQKGLPIEVRHIHKVLKAACRELGIKGNYGSHTMRKTFAYHAYKRKPDIKALNRALNHSALSVTRVYIKGAELEGEEVRQFQPDELYTGLNL